jgi:CRP-like cAMP-binding protein
VTDFYRVDHYLGKETVQNLLAFRFANQMFEPLWNEEHVDHIQLSVSEAVSVEGRGDYYDRSGVLRDMIQNHMFQMLAYICMEPPTSFAADDVRDEKAKLLRAIRVYPPQEALRNTIRGQYGPGKKADGTVCPAYREEADVDPQSQTETFAALRLFIDNWRWNGVPIYLRSGKALWKRGSEVDEVMIYSCLADDPMLFSRTDLLETAWRIAQPILDAWAGAVPTDFPNDAAGTWGPRAAYDLLERDGRRWFEVANREVLERVPLFCGGDPLLLSQVSMALQSRAVSPGEIIVRQGHTGWEMYLICRGEVEVLDSSGRPQATLREGDCFGEVGLLLSEPRTATVRAKTPCALFVLDKAVFSRIMRDHQQFAQSIQEIARERYSKAVAAEQLMAPR